LYFRDINDLSISNIKIMGIHNEDKCNDVRQGNSPLLIGAKDRLKKASNISVVQVDFENAAEDLLVFWNDNKSASLDRL
jgi:hypothetical protein